MSRTYGSDSRLKSLNRLRETNPKLNFGRESLAAIYSAGGAVLLRNDGGSFSVPGESQTPAARLLASTWKTGFEAPWNGCSGCWA